MLRLTQAAVFAACIAKAVSLPPITVKGSKLFADGQQFYVKGVAYQGTPDDPLVDIQQCTWDANLMKTLGTNSIRVYHVDPKKNHNACMKMLEDSGIYVWLDLSTFSTAISPESPAWTTEQFEAFARVMDAFQGYNNLAGFWIGNENINSIDRSQIAPYLKAAVSDMKAYRAAKGYRNVPIGYSAADIAELRPQVQNYLACGSPDSQIEFFGLNSYEWCGDANYDTSGYHNLQNMAANYSVPIFMSETGCIVPRPRSFADQNAIFGPQMVDTWSGAIIYEWVQEGNDYGIVHYPDGKTFEGTPIPMEPEFSNLKRIWKKIHPKGVAENDYHPNLTAPACPPANPAWRIDGDVPLPTLGATVVQSIAGRSPIAQVSNLNGDVSPQATTSLASSQPVALEWKSLPMFGGPTLSIPPSTTIAVATKIALPSTTAPPTSPQTLTLELSASTTTHTGEPSPLTTTTMATWVASVMDNGKTVSVLHAFQTEVPSGATRSGDAGRIWSLILAVAALLV